jgi:hypothetical protein
MFQCNGPRQQFVPKMIFPVITLPSDRQISPSEVAFVPKQGLHLKSTFKEHTNCRYGRKDRNAIHTKVEKFKAGAVTQEGSVRSIN